jgi:hypothetical protein
VAVEECVADAVEVSSMDLVAFYFLFFGWMDPCIKLESSSWKILAPLVVSSAEILIFPCIVQIVISLENLQE